MTRVSVRGITQRGADDKTENRNNNYGAKLKEYEINALI
jgi:hypothetical protein